MFGTFKKKKHYNLPQATVYPPWVYIWSQIVGVLVASDFQRLKSNVMV